MSKRGRKMTVKGIVNQSIKNNIGWAKYYRDLNKRIRDIGNSLPIGLPVENLEIDSFQLIYSPETKEQANSIRAEVGKIFGVKVWDKNVNQYDGSIQYKTRVKLANGREIFVSIKNGELAPGCKVIKVEETRTVYKSVCPDSEGNSELELTN